MKPKTAFIGIVLLSMILLFQNKVLAHCDTMDGPVVKAAKLALEKGDVAPVLRWIKKEYEDEVRSAFKRTLEVRTKGKEARELADMYFFETLVRLHRAGEGEPYTGLKSSGTPIEPPVVLADKALEAGDVKELVQHLTSALDEGIVTRFKHALEAKKEADKSVEAGREFVEAYVEFVHYAERLHEAAESNAHHNEGSEKHDIH
ncbi:MAG: DUF6448 family protein [Bacteroidota bacterium]|jgi:hypothetical protein